MIMFKYDANMLDDIGVTDSQLDDVRDYLIEKKFIHNQGNSYIVKDPIMAVSILQGAGEEFKWFGSCLAMVRLLQINENLDLMPIIPRFFDK